MAQKLKKSYLALKGKQRNYWQVAERITQSWKVTDNGKEVNVNQLAQDTGSLVPEDALQNKNGELNYGATVKIKTYSEKAVVLSLVRTFVFD